MKAVIMAGGQGSRLRPLTINRPKPMVPLVDRPVMAHIVGLLKQHGFDEIVATLQYMADRVQDYFGGGSSFGVKFHYSVEEVPLGTAGSVKLAEHLLDEPFLVISGDALTDFDLSRILEFHRERKAMVTITLTRVPNPLEYGVIIVDDDGRVKQFLEKPSWGEVFSDTVNTGIYVLDPRVLEYMEPDQPFDFSKDLFPILMEQGQPIYGYIAEGYWCDIGNIQEYMRATADYLEGRVQLEHRGQEIRPGLWCDKDVELSPGAIIEGAVYLGDGCRVHEGTIIYGPSVIRDSCILEGRAHVDRSIIWRNSYIAERAELRGAIVGRQCTVKRRAMLFEGSVIGDGTTINSGAIIQPGVKIWPNKEIEEGATVSSSIIWGAQGRKVLFGRYGVSGLVNVDISPEFAGRLGAAYGAILDKGAVVTMNRDAHYTPRMIKRALIAGLPSAGVNVADLHSMPIPVARYVTHALGMDGGIHVRLSPFDNRVVDIIFFDRRGLDLASDVQRKIERTFFQEDFRRVYLDDIGRIFDPPQVLQNYISAFRDSLDMEVLRQSGPDIRLVVDYANSSGGSVLSAILDELNYDVIALNATVDDRRLYQTAQEFEQAMQRLQAVVPAVGAHFGVRLDTGGERIYVVDDQGRRVDSMRTLVLMVALQLEGPGEGNIAVPVSAPSAVDKLAEQHGRQVVRSKVDPAALMNICAQDNILVSGDGGGSLIFPQFYPISDGLFAIVKLLELLVRRETALSQFLQQLPSYHLGRIKVSCRWESKGRVMRLLNEQYSGRILDRTDGIKIGLGGGEWVLIVPDADGPYFHIYAEGVSEEQAQVLVEKYAGLVASLQ
ncbi:MAG: mannose-1-phosphate guanyltransferase [Chloroflexia bacterium]|nr:mannose-1-phosphate guanyltransferase [Chloroflexia bacterium]